MEDEMISEKKSETYTEPSTGDIQEIGNRPNGKRKYLRFRSSLRSAVEFIGEHPFATGLLALLGVLGLALSGVGFFIDREESEETTAQLLRVEKSIAAVTSEMESQRDYIQNAATAFLGIKNQLAELDLSDEELWQRALGKVAKNSGISLRNLQATIALFVASVGQDESASQMDKALVEFASGEFDSSGDLALLVAKEAAQKRIAAETLMERISDAHQSARVEERQALTFAGQSRLAGGRYLEAAAALESALDVDATLRNVEPLEWAKLQHMFGNAAEYCAGVSEGQEIHMWLQRSIDAYRLALKVNTRESLPQDWAMTQNNLAIALNDQALAVSDAERTRLLEEAVSAYRLALEVHTRESLPQDWAMTQNNLAAALSHQADAVSGAERTRLLEEAVSAYRLALEVYTRESLPQGWAKTQNNLALALNDQALAVSGAERTRLLEEAVSAYRLALEVQTRESLPQDWAMAQNNLALALSDQADVVSGAERVRLLSEALAAMRLVLEVWTEELAPSMFNPRQSWIEEVEAELDATKSELP